VRFLLDQNLPPLLADLLVAADTTPSTSAASA
jgi:hypothetical protein